MSNKEKMSENVPGGAGVVKSWTIDKGTSSFTTDGDVSHGKRNAQPRTLPACCVGAVSG